MIEGEFHLEIKEFKEGDLDVRRRPICDGCDGRFEVGDLYVDGIQSCCGGGCSRNLCELCIKESFDLLKKEKNNNNGSVNNNRERGK